jgi:hypothetical protein
MTYTWPFAKLLLRLVPPVRNLAAEIILSVILHPHLLPRCYQDRTNQALLPQCEGDQRLWFLVGLGCLR